MHVRPSLKEELCDVVAPEPDREHQRRDRFRQAACRKAVLRLDVNNAVNRRALQERALELLDVVGADRGEEHAAVGGVATLGPPKCRPPLEDLGSEHGMNRGQCVPWMP